MKFSRVCTEIINYSFYLLFFFVPLVWLPITSELFEFNKIILTYFLTVIIVTAWLLKALSERELKLKRTLLDIPILIFLSANILATIFSIDPQTSVFGYYGRWNSALLPTLAYILLYYALINNSTREQIYYFLVTLLTSGIVIAGYAVLQHPNPLFRETIGGQTVWHGIDYDYWAVDVENRVFSTFGQPNWLAAYLAMLLLPLISLLFIFKKFWQLGLILLTITLFYLAFTFTYSRGGLVGLLLGVLTFVLLLPIYKESLVDKIKRKIPVINLSVTLDKLKEFIIPLFALLVIIILVNQLFGNALSKRGGLQTNTSQTSTQNTVENPQPTQTQLDTGGAQTATIRTIVWTGAWQTFLHYPIFGSGLETFGYSYYKFRPVEHNYTTEWDFLYNKAHNEFVNYLSTTGAIGFLSYILFIVSFEFLAIRQIVRSSWGSQRFLALGLLAGFNTALGANFFGFSVVATQILFFAFPAFFVVLTNQFNKKEILLKLPQKRLANNITKLSTLAVGLILLFNVGAMWFGDYFYNRSFATGDYQSGIKYLRLATKLVPTETVYQTELAENLASLAAGSQTEKGTNPAENSASEARELINRISNSHPNNTSVWQSKRRIDFNLSKFDEASKNELAKTAEKLKTLAPKDASIQYDVALIYLYLNKNQTGQNQLEEVVSLKKDYQEAVLMLARTYEKNDKIDQAIKTLREWLKTHPGDSEAEELLKAVSTS